MNGLLGYAATFLGGAILAHLWDRIIRRITVLRYTVFHQHIALSGADSRLGSIKVQYNEVLVNSLYLSTVEISNDTNRDIANLEIEVVCDQTSTILKSEALNKSSARTLNLTERYSKLLLNDDPTQAKNILSFRDYLVPVLNRRDVIQVTLLVTNEAGRPPVITAGCDHIGVRLRFQKEVPQKLFGEPQNLSVLIGLAMTVTICYFIVLYRMNLSPAVWYAFLLGAVGGTMGAFVLKLFRFLRRLFS
jgi:hypothetical protein